VKFSLEGAGALLIFCYNPAHENGLLMTSQPGSQFVLITGASTGIGAACVRGCAKRGMTVFAGVRSLQAGHALKATAGEDVIPLQLDVTDGASIASAAEIVRHHVREKGLSGLVNNAGIAIGSPLELIPLDQLRRQLDVNVIGLVAVTQALLPLLRRGRGRIVNMGSIAGRGTIPMMGPYSASKHALEALTDALRLELYPWGIEVSIIEPGAVATPIWNKSLSTALELEDKIPAEGKGLYELAAQRIRDAVARAEDRAIPPEAVVRAVVHALTARRPKTRYLVGSDAKVRAIMLKWLPDRVQDWILKRVLHLP
jgi:NAD(P)-dependent dehydrogenase (short-subunit alcohol dehydrogenase family)